MTTFHSSTRLLKGHIILLNAESSAVSALELILYPSNATSLSEAFAAPPSAAAP